MIHRSFFKIFEVMKKYLSFSVMLLSSHRILRELSVSKENFTKQKSSHLERITCIEWEPHSFPLLSPSLVVFGLLESDSAKLVPILVLGIKN